MTTAPVTQTADMHNASWAGVSGHLGSCMHCAYLHHHNMFSKCTALHAQCCARCSLLCAWLAYAQVRSIARDTVQQYNAHPPKHPSVAPSRDNAATSVSCSSHKVSTKANGTGSCFNTGCASLQMRNEYSAQTAMLCCCAASQTALRVPCATTGMLHRTVGRAGAPTRTHSAAADQVQSVAITRTRQCSSSSRICSGMYPATQTQNNHTPTLPGTLADAHTYARADAQPMLFAADASSTPAGSTPLTGMHAEPCTGSCSQTQCTSDKFIFSQAVNFNVSCQTVAHRLYGSTSSIQRNKPTPPFKAHTQLAAVVLQPPRCCLLPSPRHLLQAS
jgi:hypothetical protein